MSYEEYKSGLELEQLPDNQNELMAEFERRKRVKLYFIIYFYIVNCYYVNPLSYLRQVSTVSHFRIYTYYYYSFNFLLTSSFISYKNNFI